jgi:orotidine-5'-phosphate decarboxylase
LKFFDVPETVGRTISRLSEYGATFATIHGNQALMEKAVEHKGELKILAVTALTSLDSGDLEDLGFKCDVQDLVISRAKRAFQRLFCLGQSTSPLIENIVLSSTVPYRFCKN